MGGTKYAKKAKMHGYDVHEYNLCMLVPSCTSISLTKGSRSTPRQGL